MWALPQNIARRLVDFNIAVRLLGWADKVIVHKPAGNV